MVETLGPLSDEAHSLIAEIDRRAMLCTADLGETTFLYQRISTAVQCFNAVCLAKTFTVSESPLHLLISRALGIKYQGKKIIIITAFV